MKIEEKIALTAEEISSVKGLQRKRERESQLYFKMDLGIFDSVDGTVRHLLIWEKERLIGYMLLSCYDPVEIEVTAVLIPEEQLIPTFHLAFEQLKENSKNAKWIFIVSANDLFLKDLVKGSQCKYLFSEYRMFLDVDSLNLLPESERMIEPAKITDQEALALLDETTELPDISDISQTLVYKINNEVIAKARIDEEAHLYGIYGFVVKKEWRGKGIGKQFLTQVLLNIRTQKPHQIYLEVEVNNDSALSLYQKLGFKIVETFDYYE